MPRTHTSTTVHQQAARALYLESLSHICRQCQPTPANPLTQVQNPCAVGQHSSAGFSATPYLISTQHGWLHQQAAPVLQCESASRSCVQYHPKLQSSYRDADSQRCRAAQQCRNSSHTMCRTHKACFLTPPSGGSAVVRERESRSCARYNPMHTTKLPR